MLDDEENLPVLKQIYEQIKKDDDVKEFYWTIRVMTGPAALKFRSQVRKAASAWSDCNNR